MTIVVDVLNSGCGGRDDYSSVSRRMIDSDDSNVCTLPYSSRVRRVTQAHSITHVKYNTYWYCEVLVRVKFVWHHLKISSRSTVRLVGLRLGLNHLTHVVITRLPLLA